MPKSEVRDHEVSLFDLVGETKFPWNLQIVERTITTTENAIVKNVTTISHIRFQTYGDVVNFANELKSAVMHRSMVGRFEDRRKEEVKLRRKPDRRK